MNKPTHPLEPYFEPVGELIVLFNHLDQLLLLVTTGLCTNEFGAVSALMAEASFSRKIDAFKCVCDHKITDPAMTPRIKEVLKLLQRAEDGRNQIGHTVWMKNAEGMFCNKWVARRKTGNDPRLRKTTLAPIREATAAVRAAFVELADISGAFKQLGLSGFSLYPPGFVANPQQPLDHFGIGPGEPE